MRASQDTYQDFFLRCPEMLLLAGIDGAIHQANEALTGALGPIGEGARLVELVHPDDLGSFEEAWTRLGDGAEAVQFVARLRADGGGHRALAFSARKSNGGSDVYVALRPAPEPEAGARRAQAPAPSALPRESGTIDPSILLRTIYDHLPIGVWALDQRGVFTVHEGCGLASAGLRSGQFIGQNMYELMAGDEEALAPVRRAFAGQTTHNLKEFFNVHWESWTLPLRDAAGEIVGVVGVSLNITEQKRIENDLRAKLELVDLQGRVIRELGTPIIQVWDQVLTVPMMGVVDSRRAADVMDSLLAEVSSTRARFTILDLTGVETMDTATAGHILRMAAAIRLLGAEAIITGIRPVVAQTMVALGLDLSSVVTLSNLRDGLRLCMKKLTTSKLAAAPQGEGAPRAPGDERAPASKRQS